jgi:hypothetical protein
LQFLPSRCVFCRVASASASFLLCSLDFLECIWSPVDMRELVLKDFESLSALALKQDIDQFLGEKFELVSTEPLLAVCSRSFNNICKILIYIYRIITLELSWPVHHPLTLVSPYVHVLMLFFISQPAFDLPIHFPSLVTPFFHSWAFNFLIAFALLPVSCTTHMNRPREMMAGDGVHDCRLHRRRELTIPSSQPFLSSPL